MSNEKKVSFEIKDNKILAGFDNDKDGENSLSLEVSLSEAIKEAFAKGDAIEGVKAVSIKFELTKLVILVDSDKDGESLVKIEVDLGESFSEVSGAISK